MFVLSRQEIEALRDGRWERRCFRMELTRADGQKSFTGTGVIRQRDDGSLGFMLIDTEHAGGLKNFFKDMQRTGLQAGQFYPEGMHFRLNAVDTSGNEWVSSGTLDQQPHYAATQGAVVEGTIRELICTKDLREVSQFLRGRSKPGRAFRQLHIDFYVFGDLRDYPVNKVLSKERKIGSEKVLSSESRSVADFECNGHTFRLMKDDGIVSFTITSKRNRRHLPDGAELRFVEALQFVLGRPFDWQCSVIDCGDFEKAEVRTLKQQVTGRMPPPLATDGLSNFAEVWALFAKYLRFIYTHRGKAWHPLTSRVYTMQYGRRAPWNIWMVTAGVEVEGLLRDYFGVTSKPETALKKLAADGKVRMDDVIAWRHIRHSSAHALSGETEVSQENLDRLNRVTVLFYHLVFALIGYKGKYTDYGKLGFPEARYP